MENASTHILINGGRGSSHTGERVMQKQRFEDAGLGVMWPQNKNSILNFKFTE